MIKKTETLSSENARPDTATLIADYLLQLREVGIELEPYIPEIDEEKKSWL